MYQRVDKDLKTDICVHDSQTQTSCKRLISFPTFAPSLSPIHSGVARKPADSSNGNILPLQSSNPPVSIIDADAEMRKNLLGFCQSAGYAVHAYGTAMEFFDHYDNDAPGCLVLDTCLPDMHGLEVQQKLNLMGLNLAIVFVSRCSKISLAVQAIKLGAVDYLPKPVNKKELLAAIAKGIAINREMSNAQAIGLEFKQRFALLSPREHEVFGHVIAGRLNKQIAFDLGVCEQTIKVHRTHLMHKLQVKTLLQLSRVADKAGML